LRKARRVGAVDTTTLSLKDGVRDADFIILATPVLKIVELGRKAARFAKEGAIMTDAGSTKKYIVEKLEETLPKSIKFVGSHPMAGSEKGGPLSAIQNLFKGRVCFVTKTGRTDKKALDTVMRFWRKLGAKVVEISPDKHDSITAQVSQMVHLVASSLVLSNKDVLEHTAGGFRDTTRIALSDPGLWKDICLTNDKEIIRSLDKFIGTVKIFRAAVSKKKASQIQGMLNQARELRKNIK